MTILLFFGKTKINQTRILIPQVLLPEDKVVSAQLRDEQQKCGHSRETS